MHNFRELKIWKESMELASDVYSMTRDFPKEELYNLTSQINRAIISISANIAEGAGRNGNKEFNQFLGIALGSCFELETLITLSHTFKYIETEKFKNINQNIIDLQKMIGGFKNTLTEKQNICN